MAKAKDLEESLVNIEVAMGGSSTEPLTNLGEHLEYIETLIQGGGSEGKVEDVQVNGTSVLEDKVANINLKTINGEAITGTGNVQINTYKVFNSSWDVAHTVDDFCASIIADSEAIEGNAYLGGVVFTDFPSPQLANADIIVEVITGTQAANKVIHIIMTSGSIAPYHWEYTYWTIDSIVHKSGWVAFEPAGVSKVSSIDGVEGAITLGAGLAINNSSKVLDMAGTKVSSLGSISGDILLGEGLEINNSTLNLVDTKVSSLGNVSGDIALGTGLEINNSSLNLTGTKVSSIANVAGDISLGTGLDMNGSTIELTGTKVESIGGKSGIITLGTGLAIDANNSLDITGTKVDSIGGKSGAVTLGAGLAIDSNNSLDVTGTKVSSFGGKTGDITFQPITLDNQSEFIVNNNNQFVRNIHLFQHNITISAPSKDCTVTFSLILNVGVPLNSAEALLTLNAFIPNYTIFANGIYKVGTANHQQILSLQTKNENDTAFDLTMVNSTGTVNTATLDQSDMTAVADSVIVII